MHGTVLVLRTNHTLRQADLQRELKARVGEITGMKLKEAALRKHLTHLKALTASQEGRIGELKREKRSIEDELIMTRSLVSTLEKMASEQLQV